MLREAVENSPTNAQAHNNLGAFLAERGRLSDAQFHFIRAVRFAPTEPTARCNLGLTFNVQGQHQAATAQFREAVAVSPNSAEAQLLLGGMLAQSGDFDLASRHLSRALALAPKDPNIHYQLGLVDHRRGELAGAAKKYADAVALDEEFVPALIALAWLQVLSSDSQPKSIDQAVQLADRVRKITGDCDATILNLIAGVYATAGRGEEALHISQQALALAESDGQNELCSSIRLHFLEFQVQHDRQPDASPTGLLQQEN